jgi:hypothetical protein
LPPPIINGYRNPSSQSNRIESILTFFPTDEDEDDNGDGNLEPISQDNIISGGRRTRGKQINWENVHSQNADAMEDEEDDDEDYQGAGDDNDDQMRD